MKIKNKCAKIMATLMAAFSFGLIYTNQAEAYSINTTYQLAGNQGDMRVAKRNVIIAHDVGNPTTLGLNNAIYMNRTFNSAYTQHNQGFRLDKQYRHQSRNAYRLN